MRQFYQHYFTATAKLCWLRWLSVPQRLTMLEGADAVGGESILNS